ncbi:PAS domain-containing protein [Kiloniella laminariae]|uniref:PAS domain-containing protein n=1 Tax=Kiloniella laminariae TaxID=454162 RepID=A0ABT4LF40_9PROT|nr:PAS domain-containing protein [Kiloniella laminariae]MCZ4279719.1 PAS domain-containing protein [Kiloniella laminariae]
MLEFRHKKTGIFFDYWRELPRQGLLPSRSDFHPEDLPSLLSNFMIYELVSRDYIKVRLRGSVLGDRLGYHGIGDNYLDLVEKSRRSKASESLWAMATQPCGMYVIIEQELKSGLMVQMESLGLPFANSQGETPLIIFQKNEIDSDQAREAEIASREAAAAEDVLEKIGSEMSRGKEPEAGIPSPGDGDCPRFIRPLERIFIDIGAGISTFRD